MNPSPSREPARVTDALAEAWAADNARIRANVKTASPDPFTFPGGRSLAAVERIDRLISDRARYQERIREYREALANWNEHLGGCSAGRSKLPCKCGVEEARALLKAPDAK